MLLTFFLQVFSIRFDFQNNPPNPGCILYTVYCFLANSHYQLK